jgi:hypothetical protein
MYDCIKLEAGDPVTDHIQDTYAFPITRPVKYLVNGRLVIEKAGRRYTADGRMIE